MQLGKKIRDLRLRRGLTVQQLAGATGLSKGFISQVENHRTSPSLATLHDLARALDTSAAYLVVEEDQVPCVIRASQRSRVPVGGNASCVEVLSAQPKRNLELIQVELPAGLEAGDHRHYHHGEQCLLCVEGEIRLNCGEHVIELHPDNQYDPRFIPALLEKAQSDRYVIVMGSRFLPPRRALEGGMPFWKYVSNRILTFLNGALLGVYLSEFHTGQRVYNATWARDVPFERLSDDFALGFQLVGQAVDDGWKMTEIPAYCRYFAEASSNPLGGSIRYGLGTLSESCRVFMVRIGLRAPRKRTS